MLDEATLERRRLASGKSNMPLPELRTFSLPSSSFNASLWVSSGIAPPLAGPNVAGIGQGLTGRLIQPKLSALIMPGQGSQYVNLARDFCEKYKSARDV